MKEIFACVEEFLHALGRVVTGIRTYLPSHPAVISALRDTLKTLEELFEQRPSFTIGLHDDEVIFDGKPIREKAGMVTHLLKDMETKNIKSFTIDKGVTLPELEALATIVSMRAREVVEDGSIRKNLLDKLTNIKLNEIEYKVVGEGKREEGAGEGEGGSAASTIQLVTEHFENMKVRLRGGEVPPEDAFGCFESAFLSLVEKSSVEELKAIARQVASSLPPEAQQAMFGRVFEGPDAVDSAALLSRFSLENRASILSRQIEAGEVSSPQLKESARQLLDVESDVVRVAELISSHLKKTASTEEENKEYISRLFSILKEEELSAAAPKGAKILVADELPDTTREYKTIFSPTPHEIIFCRDGNEALKMIEEERPDVVILGVKIPGMSGIEIISSLHFGKEEVPVILCTAFPAFEDVYEVRSYPKIRFFAKPVNGEKLLLAVSDFAPREKERMEEPAGLGDELERAKQIQQKLLPIEPPRVPGFEFSGFYNPTRDVGGDYFDFIPIDETHLGIVIADVAGKGIPGAMVMVMLRSVLRMIAGTTLSPRDVLIHANSFLIGDMRPGMFVTVLYMVLDLGNSTVRLANAGHSPVALYRSANGTCELITIPGMAIGLVDGETFEEAIQDREIPLSRDDFLCLYTDGVVEAMNEQNKEFGEEKLAQTIQASGSRSGKELIDIILKAVGDHRQKAPQNDDIAMVVLKRT